MKKIIIAVFLLSIIFLISCNPFKIVVLKNQPFDKNFLIQLRSATLVNNDEVLRARDLQNNNGNPKEWLTDNPYDPFMPLSDAQCKASIECSYGRKIQQLNPLRFPAQKSVYLCWTNRKTTQSTAEVCGVKFLNDEKTKYRLKSFRNISRLQKAQGYYLTHFQACGTCSSLQDLAVYGEFDLTKMAKTCSKRLSLKEKKKCMEKIGFTEGCAETWAFNGANTAEFCKWTCVKTYGLFELLFGTESVPPANKSGKLNPCILCDERLSGPGFQYGAGRTRRSSGITSEIDRPGKEIYSVQHNYFN